MATLALDEHIVVSKFLDFGVLVEFETLESIFTLDGPLLLG